MLYKKLKFDLYIKQVRLN